MPAFLSAVQAAFRLPMHIAMICHTDPRDPSACSGLPFSVWTQLKRMADKVTLIYPGAQELPSPLSRLRTRIGRELPGHIHERLRTVRGGNAAASNSSTSAPPKSDPINTATTRAAGIRAQLEGFDGDLVFNCMMSSLLYEIHPNVPFIHFTDATARVVDEFYPAFEGMTREQISQFDVIELEVLPRAAAIVFISQVVRQRAIAEYKLNPDLIHAIPPGSNIRTAPSRMPIGTSVPSRDDLILSMTASDPKRKRVDFTVEVIDSLRERGWNASLTLVGRPSNRAVQSQHVRCAGFMKISSRWDQRRYMRLLSTAHLMILPSKAETFGIAPIEAALVERPSIVSDAFGLPEAVLHDKTGIVMQLDASPSDFAEAIIALCEDPGRYHRLGKAARRRAIEELNWDHWGDRVRAIIEHVLAAR